MKTILTALILLTSTAYAALPLDYHERVVTMTILGEARGEGKAGMYAVACVILKRVEERKMPPTLVCLQKKQFSCWNNGNKINEPRGEHLFKLLNGSEEHLYAMELAVAVMRGKLKLEYVKHANHYCTLKTNPYWAKGKTPVKIIGNHKFFKLD